jgi:hypothetical protein
MTGIPTRRAWIDAFLLLIAGAASARAQQVRLRVTSDTLDTPVAKALVVSLNDRALWRTDDEGMIVVSPVHHGSNVFTIRHIGFAPVTTTLDVPEHGTLAVHVIMRPAPQVLDTVAISARESEPRMSVFDQRRMDNPGGHFLTWADIERQRPRETLDLFRNVLGLQVVNVRGIPTITSSRGFGVGGASCRPRLGFDGIVLSSDFDVNDISPGEIYGIEIYDGAATIPGQYLASASGGSCGLVMIWTVNAAHESARRP